MKLTGDEKFIVKAYRKPPRSKQLATMSDVEILTVANDKATPCATKAALYAYQYQRRHPHTTPPKAA